MWFFYWKKRYTQSLKDNDFFIFTKNLFSKNPTFIYLFLYFYASKFLSLYEFLYFYIIFILWALIVSIDSIVNWIIDRYLFFILSMNYWSVHLETVAALYYLLSNYIYFIIEFYRNFIFQTYEYYIHWLCLNI